MPVSLHSCITATLLLMCHMFCQLHAQQCRSEYSTYGMMLRGQVFKEKITSNLLTCAQSCNDDVRCQSVNYVISHHTCELNSRTREARPEHFISNGDRIYVTRLSGRGILRQLLSLSKGCLCYANYLFQFVFD